MDWTVASLDVGLIDLSVIVELDVVIRRISRTSPAASGRDSFMISRTDNGCRHAMSVRSDFSILLIMTRQIEHQE